MSAWKKPSRSAWRRKDCIRRGASAGRSWPAALSASRSRQLDAVDPFERQHVARGPLPVDRRHAEALVVRGGLGHLRERRRLEAEVHLHRHRAGQRVDHRDRPEPLATPGRGARPAGRRRRRSSRSRRKRRAMPGRSTFTATSRGCRRRASTSALWTWAIEAAATGGENAAKSVVDRRAERAAIAARASLGRTARSRPQSSPRSRATSLPTMSGRVARNWPSLT